MSRKDSVGGRSAPSKRPASLFCGWGELRWRTGKQNAVSQNRRPRDFTQARTRRGGREEIGKALSGPAPLVAVADVQQHRRTRASRPLLQLLPPLLRREVARALVRRRQVEVARAAVELDEVRLRAWTGGAPLRGGMTPGLGFNLNVAAWGRSKILRVTL